jgi:hypothetical protein
MAEMPKLDERYRHCSNTAKDCVVGDKGIFAVKDMRVDLEWRCWINPLAELQVDPHVVNHPGAPPDPWPKLLIFERVDGGFKIGFRCHGHTWETETQGKPAPKTPDGIEWFPVVGLLDRA